MQDPLNHETQWSVGPHLEATGLFFDEEYLQALH